jgi:prevent-host-death family protein
MRTVQLREAKAQLSALVQAAENGETTIITKNGRPSARIGPAKSADEKESATPNLIDYLMSMPADIPIRRNRSRSRKVKF